MNPARSDLLNLRRLPGRLNVEETAHLLGFQPHDIPVLITGGLLKPLGNPTPVAPKWFASCELELLCRDEKFLARATKAISSRWRARNARLKVEAGAAETAP